MGRPSSYNEEIAALICEQLAEGKSLRTVCAAEEMPSISAVFTWLRERESFQKQYARAKEEGADALVEDMLVIADDSELDYIERTNEHGKTYRVVDQEAINRARLRVDTRKWIASKLKAKVYGDRIQQNISGEDGGALKIVVTGIRPTAENT